MTQNVNSCVFLVALMLCVQANVTNVQNDSTVSSSVSYSVPITTSIEVTSEMTTYGTTGAKRKKIIHKKIGFHGFSKKLTYFWCHGKFPVHIFFHRQMTRNINFELRKLQVFNRFIFRNSAVCCPTKLFCIPAAAWSTTPTHQVAGA